MEIPLESTQQDTWDAVTIQPIVKTAMCDVSAILWRKRKIECFDSPPTFQFQILSNILFLHFLWHALVQYEEWVTRLFKNLQFNFFSTEVF